MAEVAVMSRTKRAGLAIVATAMVVVAAAALWLVPIWTGPSLPEGATRLHIITESPHLTFGCASAALAPVRVANAGDQLLVMSVESGDTVPVVWPSGFAAWRAGGRAVLADPWGNVIGGDGDVLDSLGGGSGADDLFHICPLGIVHATER